MDYQYNIPGMGYSPDHSAPPPPPPYETVGQMQTVPYQSFHRSTMEQIPPFETSSQTYGSNARYEDENQPAPATPYRNKSYDTPSTPYYANQSQIGSAVASAVTNTSPLNMATQSYANHDFETIPSAIKAPSIIHQPLDNGRYNHSSPYSLEDKGPAYHRQASTSYTNSEGGDLSQQNFLMPQIQDQFSLGSPSYANAELQGYGSNLSSEASFVYSKSSHYPISSPVSLPTTYNVASIDHESAFSASRFDNWDTVKPPDIQYTPSDISLVGGTTPSSYAQPQNEDYTMMQEEAVSNKGVRASRHYGLHTSYQTLQVPVVHQRRGSVPTLPFASMNISSTDSSYHHDKPVHTDTTQHRQYNKTYSSRHRSQSASIDDMSPRSYPSRCLHPDCASNPNKPKVFKRDKEWRDHFYRSHEKRYRCGFANCTMLFGTQAEARRHRLAVHNIGIEEARQYSCLKPNCQARRKSFNRGDKFKDHCGRWHGPFYCEMQGCSRGPGHGYKDQAALDAHVQREHMQR